MERRPPTTWHLFHETVLAVAGRPAPIDLRKPLDAGTAAFLRGLLPRPRFAVVTPADPCGQTLPMDENLARLALLARELDLLQIPHVRADGTSPDGGHVEPGFAVPLKLLAAVRLAERWEQLGLFWFDGSHVWIVPVHADEAPVRLPIGG
jgi:hypothetical protein